MRQALLVTMLLGVLAVAAAVVVSATPLADYVDPVAVEQPKVDIRHDAEERKPGDHHGAPPVRHRRGATSAFRTDDAGSPIPPRRRQDALALVAGSAAMPPTSGRRPPLPCGRRQLLPDRKGAEHALARNRSSAAGCVDIRRAGRGHRRGRRLCACHAVSLRPGRRPQLCDCRPLFPRRRGAGQRPRATRYRRTLP